MCSNGSMGDGCDSVLVVVMVALVTRVVEHGDGDGGGDGDGDGDGDNDRVV